MLESRRIRTRSDYRKVTYTHLRKTGLAGKPLELDCLTGAAIEIAARVGVDVPQTRAVHDLLTAFADLGDPWTSR